MKIRILLLVIGSILCGCSTFTKIEITDDSYIQIPSKTVNKFSFGEYHIVHYSGGITYCFTDTISGGMVILANHPYPGIPYFPERLPYYLHYLQSNPDMQEVTFSWSGSSPELHCINTIIEKYEIRDRYFYWSAMLISHPSFAPNCDWLFIGYDNVPQNEVRLYKKIFLIKKHRHSFKKRSPWAPLFNPDNIDRIYKELYHGNSD